MRKAYQIKKAPKTTLLSVLMGWHKVNEKYKVTLSHNHDEIVIVNAMEWKASTLTLLEFSHDFS
jgi:hypothetical protein